MKVFAHYMGNEKDWNLSEDGFHEEASEQELWYENIRYRFYPGLQVTFDKKTVNIRFAYKKNNGFSIADYNNPDEKKARNLQVISK